VLAETDVTNRVSRGIPTPDILEGIHLSMASRIVKPLKVTGIKTIGAVLWGGVASRAPHIACSRPFRQMRRAGLLFGIVVASLGTAAPETFGAAGAGLTARVPDTFHLPWRRAMTARPIRLALAAAAVVCAFPWIAHAEYRCAPPTNRIDRQACKAAAESPEALRHYVQRMRPIEILLFADYVDDATVRSWEAARARERDARKEANAAVVTTAARQ
jgi:hypothetical protein